MKSRTKWMSWIGGIIFVAIVGVGYGFLKPLGFDGSVEKLYETGMAGQVSIEKYESWVAHDGGVEMVITNMRCNEDGSGSLLFGTFSIKGREEKACWKLEGKKLGMVTNSGKFKRIPHEAFKVQTVNGQPVIAHNPVAPKVAEKSNTHQIEKINPRYIGLEAETPEVDRDKRKMSDKYILATSADRTDGLVGSSKRVVALFASPSTIGEWKYVLDVEASRMAMGDCWTEVMCFSQAEVLEARGLRLAKGLKKPF